MILLKFGPFVNHFYVEVKDVAMIALVAMEMMKMLVLGLFCTFLSEDICFFEK